MNLSDWRPVTAQDFAEIRRWSRASLLSLGMRAWDKESGLLLFPRTWYDLIPDGYEIVTISGGREVFRRGVTDADQRFGMLAFGIVRK